MEQDLNILGKFLRYIKKYKENRIGNEVICKKRKISSIYLIYNYIGDSAIFSW